MHRARLHLSVHIGALAMLSTIPAGVVAQQTDATLERIQKDGMLRWGADPSGGAPFVFTHPRKPDEIVGFEIDLMEKLAAHLNVKSELVSGDWVGLIDNLKAERIDIVLNGLEITPERAKKVRFSTPYFVYRQQLTVRAEDRDRYAGLAELRGHKVGVLNESASVRVLRSAGWSDDLIVQYQDSSSPYTDLKLGRVDAVLAESIIAAYYTGRDSGVYSLPRTFSPGRYGIALRNDSPALLAELNRVLEKMKQNGELGEIYQKWNMWSTEQEAVGIAKGNPVEMSELAQLEPDSDDWLESVSRSLLALLKGALYTLLLTAIAMPLALVFGLGLALLARSGRLSLSWPARAYIQIVRGTPLLVQVWLVYFSLPELGALIGLKSLFTWDPFVVGVLCLAGNYAAYEAEVHRAGIEAIPKGQREAALALGLSERQAFLRIILPQSFRIILPPVINDLISMLKDSCIVSVITVPELLFVALSIGKANFTVPQMLVAAAVIYLVLSLAADQLGRFVQRRLRTRGVPQMQVQLAHH